MDHDPTSAGSDPDLADAVALAVKHFGPAFETSPQPMVLFDRAFRLLVSNRATKRVTENDEHTSWQGSLVTDKPFRLVDEERSVVDIISIYEGVLESADLEGQLDTISGRELTVRVSVQAIRDESGEVTHMAGYLTDITDLRWAERVLADQLRIETVVSEATNELLQVRDVDTLLETMARFTQELGRTAQAERAFFWRVDQVGGEASLLLDWARAGSATVPLIQRSMSLHEWSASIPAALLDRPMHLTAGEIPGLAGLSEAADLTVYAAPIHGGVAGAEVHAVIGIAVSHAEMLTVDEHDVEHLAQLFAQSSQNIAQQQVDARRAEFSRFITATGALFLAPDTTEIHARITDALGELGASLGAYHVQLREVDWRANLSTVSAEWRMPGMSSSSVLSQFNVIDLTDPGMREIAEKTEPYEFQTTDFEINTDKSVPFLVLSVPLVADGVVTATLNAVVPGATAFTAEEIWAAGTLAGLIVQLQRRGAAEAELRHRLDLEDMVRSIAISFNELTADTIAAGLRRTLRRIGVTLGTHSVGLCRLDQANEKITLADTWTRPEHDSTADELYLQADRATVMQLLRTVTPIFFTSDSLPDHLAGAIPDGTQIAHIPVVRGGVPLLSLALETSSDRVWTDAELGAIRSISALVVQLEARVDAERSIMRRLELEDLTRAMATDFLSLAPDGNGVAAALARVGPSLGADGIVLWRIDSTLATCTLREHWGIAGVENHLERRIDGDLALLALAAADRPTTQSFPAGVLPLSLTEKSTTGSVVYSTLHAPDGSTQGLIGFERSDDRAWSDEEVGAIESIASMIVQLEARLEAEEYFITAFRNAPVGVTMRDAEGRLLACNPAYEAFIGSPQEEMLGETDVRFRPSESTSYEADSTNEEVAFRRGDGTMVWAKVSTTVVRRASGVTKLVLSHIEDTTERRRVVEQLEYRASHDELTGLVNRRVMLEEIRGCLSDPPQAHEAAILLLDLDRFKVANDSLGHSAGDDILRTVANRLRFAVRPGDVVSRLGGDEFVVLLKGPVDELEATNVAERLLSLVGKPIETSGGDVQTSCSVGIAFPNPADASIEDVMRHADAAMYQAKSRGRDRYLVFDEEHRDALAQRVRREQELRHAVDHQHLELFYQPEIELKSGRILGAEGLIRWRHPELGLLTAGSFIELAEESGIVVDLGRFVLNQACRQAAEWNADTSFDHPLMVRANVSARQLERTELVEEVKQALRDSGLSADQLCLEITETALMADVDDSLRILQALKDVGVRLAIDDFGTGFSSLAYLKRFPVDVLKIDQAFVRGLGEDPDDEAIVQSVLSMAKSLDLEVVAEGIETDAQRQMLVDMGCERGQGFGLVRPATPVDLEPLLRRGFIEVANRVAPVA